MAANGKYMPYLIKNICRRTGLNTKCEKQGTAIDSSLLFRRDRFGDEKRKLAAATTATVVTAATTAVVATTASAA